MRFALPALALGVCCLFPGTVDAAPVQSESHGKSPSVKINNYRVTQYQTTRNPHKDLQPLLAGDNAPDLGWLMPDENEVTVLVGLSPRGGLCAEEIRAASVPTVAGTRVRVIGVVLDPPGNRWDADERYWIGDDRMAERAMRRWRVNASSLPVSTLETSGRMGVIDDDSMDMDDDERMRHDVAAAHRWNLAMGMDRVDASWERNFGFPVIGDRNGMLATHFGLQSPCEIVVINADHEIAYAGPVRGTLSQQLASGNLRMRLLPVSRRFLMAEGQTSIIDYRVRSRGNIWDTSQDGFADPVVDEDADEDFSSEAGRRGQGEAEADDDDEPISGHIDGDAGNVNRDDDGDDDGHGYFSGDDDDD